MRILTFKIARFHCFPSKQKIRTFTHHPGHSDFQQENAVFWSSDLSPTTICQIHPMKRIAFFLALTVVFLGCSEPNNPPQDPDPTPIDTIVIPQIEERASWDTSFSRRNLVGTFLLAPSKDKWYVHNRARLDSAWLPASTFKVFNSLVLLQEKAVADEFEVVKWDGVERWVKNWNQDLNMKQAIDYSALWFYQAGARKVGMEKMKFWMDAVHYGNGIIGEDVDSFWVKGTTAITPIQQVEFLTQLYEEKLPFSKDVQQTVKRIMPSDSSQCCIIHAKTGWADAYQPQLGWYVGWVTRGDAVAYFAMNINMPRGGDDAYFRKKITREILALEGWWDGSTFIDG